MIQQTILPRVNTRIGTLTKSYRFNGGRATVQLDSFGKYELIVNGSHHSPLENIAKRDAGYKEAIHAVSKRMADAFEKRDTLFKNLHRKAPGVLTLAECKKKFQTLAPKRYRRDTFPIPRPTTATIRKELEEEARILLPDLYTDRKEERRAFVKEHEKEAIAARLRAYEEVQTFFSDLQDDKEARANAIYQQEYELKKSEMEEHLKGDEDLTKRNITRILNEMSLPYRVEIYCDYHEETGLLNTAIEIQEDMKLPADKANVLTSGRISVKAKTPREMTQFRTDTIASIIYYVAASLFNATANIRIQQVFVWLEGIKEGLICILFDRDKFAQLNMRTIKPLVNYCEWPRVDALRMMRGLSQFEPIEAENFRNAIAHFKVENGIQ